MALAAWVRASSTRIGGILSMGLDKRTGLRPAHPGIAPDWEDRLAEARALRERHLSSAAPRSPVKRPMPWETAAALPTAGEPVKEMTGVRSHRTSLPPFLHILALVAVGVALGGFMGSGGIGPSSVAPALPQLGIAAPAAPATPAGAVERATLSVGLSADRDALPGPSNAPVLSGASASEDRLPVVEASAVPDLADGLIVPAAPAATSDQPARLTNVELVSAHLAPQRLARPEAGAPPRISAPVGTPVVLTGLSVPAPRPAIAPAGWISAETSPDVGAPPNRLAIASVPTVFECQSCEPLLTAGATRRVALYAGGDDAQTFTRHLQDAGFSRIETSTPDLTVRTSQVRYFHPDDAGAARIAAELAGARIVDLTWLASRPALGSLEIWLAPDAFEASRLSIKRN
ncbi:hypothetical protein R5H30_00620 [Sulfitobacter sp. D35]|uniref:hypothetical protein n=1 Tax=Sulfitobacter sp. D35 TaxID=3083252 RepID=UPI00296F428A|nr:hypothetical protein [Sulfitobacter sp. D35]MDW4496467.1 hypothetical protein [Sulfitobacter sp. D35]